MNMNDNLIFCFECTCFVYDYCSVHGPLLIIPNTKNPLNMELDNLQEKYSIPPFLRTAPSSIPDAGLGVYTTLTIPCGVRFGPYEGAKVFEVKSKYCWQIFNKNKNLFYVDGSDENSSNWMRYINCSRHFNEQNLIAFQFKGDMYYRTIKTIPRGAELLVYYGSDCASILRINLHNYNNTGIGIDFKVESYCKNIPKLNSVLNPQTYLNNGILEENVHGRIQNKPYSYFECTYGSNEISSIKHI